MLCGAGYPGDLMRSIEILHYNADTRTLSNRARDRNVQYMMSVTALDDDCFLGAENEYNLVTVKKDSESVADEERTTLEVLLKSLEVL